MVQRGQSPSSGPCPVFQIRHRPPGRNHLIVPVEHLGEKKLPESRIGFGLGHKAQKLVGVAEKGIPDAVLVLLTANKFIHCSPPSVAKKKFPYTNRADLIFAINNSEFLPDHIITAVVRCAEDKLNIQKYSQARRFIFLIVDDEPRWFSQFLPLLYKIIGQRADVKITRTYEETLQFLFGVDDESKIDTVNYRSLGRGDDVVCLITDIFFPRGKNLNSDAGRDLVNLIHKFYHRIPIIIASKAKEADDLRNIAYIMPKGDPGSLETLSEYIHDYTGMGDFIIRSISGKGYFRIKDIRQMYYLMLDAEKNDYHGLKIRQLLDVYGQKDYFSTWLYMHGFRELGDKLRPKQDKDRRLVTTLKRHLVREILRLKYTPLIIDDKKIYDLHDLLNLLETINSEKIQKFSDNDIFSIWLDRQGYPELAEEFRPIHGSGSKLLKALADTVEKWIKIYEQRNHIPSFRLGE